MRTIYPCIKDRKVTEGQREQRLKHDQDDNNSLNVNQVNKNNPHVLKFRKKCY